MDAPFRKTLQQGARALGLALQDDASEKLERYADRLLAWNRKVNLTAITDPEELAEKHLVDSLALVPDATGAATLLDVGSGAGLGSHAARWRRGSRRGRRWWQWR